MRNYLRLLTDERFYNSLWLTLQYTLFTNLGQFVLGLSAALILGRRQLCGQNWLVAIIVLPMVIPGITQALIWSSMLGAKEFGTLNRLVGLFGMEPVLWTRTLPMLSIVLVNLRISVPQIITNGLTSGKVEPVHLRSLAPAWQFAVAVWLVPHALLPEPDEEKPHRRACAAKQPMVAG
ncbi:MAG: carbohydrate ABC transporter permease [Caldilinea sp.]